MEDLKKDVEKDVKEVGSEVKEKVKKKVNAVGERVSGLKEKKYTVRGDVAAGLGVALVGTLAGLVGKINKLNKENEKQRRVLRIANFEKGVAIGQLREARYTSVMRRKRENSKKEDSQE